jgi:hypothetical protein
MKHLTIAAIILLTCASPARAQYAEYCNQMCVSFCERHGWNSETCVECNVQCSRRSIERWESKSNECARWRERNPEKYRQYCE